MLHQAFNEVYTKFKLHFYQEIFRRFQDREASLTTVETFCMESIMALGRPTVNEFATFMCISPPNAAYKVNSLVKKGYVEKNRCGKDGRVVFVHLTREGRRIDRFHRYYHYKMVQEVSGSLTPKERDALYNGVLKLNRFFHESIDGKTDENHPKAFTGKEGQQA